MDGMPPTSMYGSSVAAAAAAAAASGATDPHRSALDMNMAALHYQNSLAAASAAANHISSNMNHVSAGAGAAGGGSGQVPDVHKRDKDAIYG